MSSSAEPERVFSNLTHLLQNTQRGNLADSSIEDLMTIRNFMVAEKAERNLKIMESDDDEIFVLHADEEGVID